MSDKVAENFAGLDYYKPAPGMLFGPDHLGRKFRAVGPADKLRLVQESGPARRTMTPPLDDLLPCVQDVATLACLADMVRRVVGPLCLADADGHPDDVHRAYTPGEKYYGAGDSPAEALYDLAVDHHIQTRRG